jgi:hypothetical protein
VNTKQELKQAVVDAKAALVHAENALAAFEADPAQNVFASLSEAENVLEDRLRDQAFQAFQAFQDCQGAYNCCAEVYEQEFIVDGKHYIGRLYVEYNRHDKMYYYIDESDFEVLPAGAP